MVKIQRRISNNRNHYNGTNKKLKITVHQTGNTSRGANAEMHARFINNGSTSTWHYTVDDKQAIQHFEHETQCWHAGDGRGNGNLHSIGVELCINRDGDYNKTIQNGAELVKYLMDTLNLGINDVVQHNHWSGKDCPKQIRAGKNGINWSKFKQMVQDNTNTSKPVKPSTNKPKPAPSKSIEQLANEVIAGKHGTGEARKKALGSNYQAVQNLVNKKLGAKPASKPSKSIEQLAQEVIAGKHGSGEARKKALGSNYQAVQKRVNQILGVGTTKPSSKPKGVKVGDTVTTKALYANSGSTKNVRSSSIKGYVDTINNNWRNPIRLRNKKGGYYIGFTRKQDIV